MPIAISDDHQTLADTAADLLAARDARGATRSLLEAPEESLPAFWDELVEVGWTGLHVPEDVSLVSTDHHPEHGWCDPPISHIAWDTGPVIRRIARWASL